MPMNPEALKGEIIAAMTAVSFVPTEGNQKLAEAIAKAVVKHIQANADVVGTCTAPGAPLAAGKVL